MILIDSNIIIDIIENDPRWSDWSIEQIVQLSAEHDVAINEVVIAEAAPGMATLEAFRREMERIDVTIESIDADAAFLAGRAFRAYRQRRREGAKSILADFLIGGHAQALNATVLTRDPRFYRSYFPTVPLITPEAESA
ncbi:type II toxin-antitoxin system VapC family toxin [Blastomonas sp.]|uniref:type II toxin-antitoxin system VapC family toxin n=1 Tax=Blastomonas sp. TaxID=1909299 RepID=UPI00261B303B|nr:type II toxin-antitoxin system VapC family toxin [Blastomonas sp.]MDM7956571.1 type II toxin-antitoxin system VapC family toxin [Blastomonas sp.]